MKILIDMNLSPRWAAFLAKSGFEAVHWTAVGDTRAPDSELLSWARENGHLVFTHDLDFGILLSMTRAVGPSVIQLRDQDVTPETMGDRLVRTLREYRAALDEGAIVTIQPQGARVRILPIQR